MLRPLRKAGKGKGSYLDSTIRGRNKARPGGLARLASCPGAWFGLLGLLGVPGLDGSVVVAAAAAAIPAHFSVLAATLVSDRRSLLVPLIISVSVSCFAFKVPDTPELPS